VSFSADNYTREDLRVALNRFAYYGVAAIFEAGTAEASCHSSAG
jgi:hypothetical protein